MSWWTSWARPALTNYVIPAAGGAAVGIATGNPALGLGVGTALKGVAEGADQARQNRHNIKYQNSLIKAQQEHDKEMLRLNQEYASPVHQAALLREAGYNPYVAGSEGMLSAPASSMGQAGNIASFSPSGYPSPSYGTFGDLFGGLDSFASAIDSLSHADLNKQQKDDLVETAIDRYMKIHEDAKKAQFEREIAGVNANVAKDFGYKMADKEFEQLQRSIDKLTSQISNIDQDTANKSEEWYKIYYDALNEQCEYLDNEKMYNAKKALTYWEKTVKNMIDKQFADIRESDSRTYNNYATGRASLQNASTNAAVGAEQIEQLKAQGISLKAAAALSTAEMHGLANEIVGAYIDDTGFHVDDAKRQEVQEQVFKQLELQTRQQGADYWNPFRYVGQALGGSGSTILKKVLK